MEYQHQKAEIIPPCVCMHVCTRVCVHVLVLLIPPFFIHFCAVCMYVSVDGCECLCV